MVKRPSEDGCAYCGHERACHVIFITTRGSETIESQICYPMLGITGANMRWIPGNWCGCNKYQDPKEWNLDVNEQE